MDLFPVFEKTFEIFFYSIPYPAYVSRYKYCKKVTFQNKYFNSKNGMTFIYAKCFKMYYIFSLIKRYCKGLLPTQKIEQMLIVAIVRNLVKEKS